MHSAAGFRMQTSSKSTSTGTRTANRSTSGGPGVSFLGPLSFAYRRHCDLANKPG